MLRGFKSTPYHDNNAYFSDIPGYEGNNVYKYIISKYYYEKGQEVKIGTELWSISDDRVVAILEEDSYKQTADLC